MDIRDFVSSEDQPFYEELTAWLDEHLPPFQKRRAHAMGDNQATIEVLKGWHREMDDGGWIGITWPEEYGGRDASGTQSVILDLELAARRVPRGLGHVSVERVGPAVILHGTPAQKGYWLPHIKRGDWVWCQGFSEPNAGSDLAALKTHAQKVDGGYKVNGSKIWTSNAYFAEKMWLLARTDRDAPKHHGISAFILDMGTPGVDVRPIRQITGETREQQSFGEQFNEVFFDDVWIPETDRIGPENQGWQIARSTLVRERATNVSGFFRDINTTLEALAKFTRDPELAELYDGDLHWLEDAYVDSRMELAGLEQLFDLATRAMLSGEGGMGGETSAAKLVASELQQRVNEIALAAAGPYGLIDAGPDAFRSGRAARGFLRSRATTLGGGTSEIQRNWIAERVLGLKSR